MITSQKRNIIDPISIQPLSHEKAIVTLKTLSLYDIEMGIKGGIKICFVFTWRGNDCKIEFVPHSHGVDGVTPRP